MLVYSVLMLLNQFRLAAGVGTGGTGGMDSTGGMGGTAGGSGMGSTMAGMGAEAGMVAIAVLMLASGIIMTFRAGTMQPDGSAMS
jgi:hypothetical protein